MINLPIATLKAAMISAPKNDARYFLNSILLRVNAAGNVFIASTDGHRAFIAKVESDWTGEAQKGPFDLIIPREAVKIAITSRKHKTLQLLAMDDGRYLLADTLFTAIDAKYPNIDQIVPSAPLSGDVATFDAQYLADAQAAIRLASGASDKNYYAMQYNGQSTGVMVNADSTVMVVIMPIRSDVPQSGNTFLTA